MDGRTNLHWAYRLAKMNEVERLQQAQEDRLIVEALRNGVKHPRWITAVMVWVGERIAHVGLDIMHHYGSPFRARIGAVHALAARRS